MRGFTLIELVVTLAIIGVLAAGVMPLAELAAQRSKESELRTVLRQIRNALDAYKAAYDEGRIEQKADASGYPPSLRVLVEGVPDVKDEEGRRMYFLRRLPRAAYGCQRRGRAHLGPAQLRQPARCAARGCGRVRRVFAIRAHRSQWRALQGMVSA
jgi:prepilin-type N-terminal cleavage/methylation domain-containing protein